MGLKGKMIGHTEVKHSGVGDFLHDLNTKTPHLVSTATPTNVQGFTLLEGQAGAPGSKVCYNYTHDGKQKVANVIIENVDDEKKSLTMKVVEGDLMELYKSFKITYHVDNDGEDDLITVTLDYEKLKEETPHPGSLLNFFLHSVEEIEAHHLKNVA